MTQRIRGQQLWLVSSVKNFPSAPTVHFSKTRHTLGKFCREIEIVRETRHLPCYHVRMNARVRRAHFADKAELTKLRALLWPDLTAADNLAEIEYLFATGTTNALPTAVFVSQDDTDALTGFIEVGLRSHADGCDPTQAVGFVEGWFVSESSRNQGIGKELMRSAEDWARARGCNEMASDALIDNSKSQLAHEAAGFEIVDRCVHFRKSLR